MMVPIAAGKNFLIPKAEGDSTVVPQSLEITAAKIIFYTYFVLRIETILPNIHIMQLIPHTLSITISSSLRSQMIAATLAMA